MKSLWFVLLVGLLLNLPATARASSITLYDITVDEYGTGTYAPGVRVLPGGGEGNGLSYEMPFQFQNTHGNVVAGVQGYFGLTDPDAYYGAPLSDIIKFQNEKLVVGGPLVGVLTFYSGDLLGAPADVGPAVIAAMMRAFDASPTAPEDASGVAVYSTEGITGGLGKPGIPGDPHGNAEVAYVFASAPTPEPTALVALCGLGGVGLVGWARRRRATR